MRRLLRQVWSEPRPPSAPDRSPGDWALAALVVVLAVVEGLVRTDLPLRWPSVLLGVALGPALLWRRSRPGLVVVVVFAVSLLLTALGGGRAPDLYTSAFALLLLYALVRWGSGREVLAGLAVVLTGAVVPLASAATPSDAVGGAAVLTTALALGAAARARAAARRRELEQVALRERERLARDLHDTVAHHVSAVAVRAQAGLAVAATRPDAATDALRVIEGEATRTLEEMRTLVRDLRHDPCDGTAASAGAAPLPGVADLQRLADPGEVGGSAGPVVAVRVSGDPADAAAVPPAVGAAVHRIAQEAVTNARRHARRASRVDVVLEVEARQVVLRVVDDGDASASQPQRAAGYGVRGMVERAALLGGSCTAGPAPGGGWVVKAVLPTRRRGLR